MATTPTTKPCNPCQDTHGRAHGMDDWLSQLGRDLQQRESQGLLRSLKSLAPKGPIVTRDGLPLVNLAGNDYLALSSHPHVRQAAIDAIEQYGVGAGASRLVSGHQPTHQNLEQRFAAFKHAEAALLCPTGYIANLAAVTALAARGDTIYLDKLCHASLIDAARGSLATMRTYPHLDVQKLEQLLARPLRDTSAGDRPARRIVITDSVFSMDGDTADLPALCDLADRYDAILIVDEAHGSGVLGPGGCGLAELQGVADRIDVTISTASKALGSLGGIITARRVVIDTIINHARPFIYTTAALPTQAAAINAALDIIEAEPQRRHRLADLACQIRHAIRQRDPQSSTAALDPPTPIIPIICGRPAAAQHLSDQLAQAGFFAPAIRPPTVPPNTSRVRISLRSDLTDDDVNKLIDVLKRAADT